jgi:four helix bundle protein
MNTHKSLIVWQKSIELVTEVYRLTKKFPEEEKFGLFSQMRRAAVSIPSNIAEGYGRKSDGEFAQFLRIAFASSSELETQLEISYKLTYIHKEDVEMLTQDLTEIRKMLNKLITTIRNSPKSQVLGAKG